VDLQKAAEILRDCLKRGTSNAPIMNVAGIRRAKWLGKPLLGGPQGYAASALETFRTVSQKLTERVSEGSAT
jgi:hypothetical protein